MKKKKYPLLIWVLLMLCLVFVFSVSAHPGRTDQNGGHWDRDSGTYHFHIGEYEGKGSGGGSSSSEYTPFTPPYDPPTDNPYRNDTNEESDPPSDAYSLQSILIAVVLLWISASSIYVFFSAERRYNKATYALTGIVFGILLIFHCSEKHLFTFNAIALALFFIIFLFIPVSECFKILYDFFIEKHLPGYKIKALNDKIDEYHHFQTEIDEIDIIIFDLELKHWIPSIYEISKDNLPKDKECISDWGKSFTLYQSNRGTKLHTKYNCCSAKRPTHIYRYQNYHNISYFLCKKCVSDYTIPDMSWYDRYLKYERARAKRENIEYNFKKTQKEIEVLYIKCNSIKTKMLILFSQKNKKALQEANKKYGELQIGTQLSLFDYLCESEELMNAEALTKGDKTTENESEGE